MHPVQATEAIQWAEKQHQDLVAQVERDQLARTLHQRPAKSNLATISVIPHPVRLAAVVMLLVAVLAVASV